MALFALIELLIGIERMLFVFNLVIW